MADRKIDRVLDGIVDRVLAYKPPDDRSAQKRRKPAKKRKGKTLGRIRSPRATRNSRSR